MARLFLLSNGMIVQGEEIAKKSHLYYTEICRHDVNEILNLLEFKRQLKEREENKPKPWGSKFVNRCY